MRHKGVYSHAPLCLVMLRCTVPVQDAAVCRGVTLSNEVNRRQFLVSFAAAIAVTQMPRQLAAVCPQPLPAPLCQDSQRYYSGAAELLTKLYELDPHMRINIDDRGMYIHLISAYNAEMIRDVLWNYLLIGIPVTLNGQAVVFEDYWRRGYE